MKIIEVATNHLLFILPIGVTNVYKQQVLHYTYNVIQYDGGTGTQ